MYRGISCDCSGLVGSGLYANLGDKFVFLQFFNVIIFSIASFLIAKNVLPNFDSDEIKSQLSESNPYNLKRHYFENIFLILVMSLVVIVTGFGQDVFAHQHPQLLPEEFPSFASINISRAIFAVFSFIHMLTFIGIKKDEKEFSSMRWKLHRIFSLVYLISFAIFMWKV